MLAVKCEEVSDLTAQNENTCPNAENMNYENCDEIKPEVEMFIKEEQPPVCCDAFTQTDPSDIPEIKLISERVHRERHIENNVIHKNKKMIVRLGDETKIRTPLMREKKRNFQEKSSYLKQKQIEVRERKNKEISEIQKSYVDRMLRMKQKMIEAKERIVEKNLKLAQKIKHSFLGVQQKRKELLEKQLGKVLEVQRIKEERARAFMKQKEENRKLLMEKNKRKRLVALKMIEEKKKREEEFILATEEKILQKEARSKRVNKAFWGPVPIYMTRPAPPLPNYIRSDVEDKDFRRENGLSDWIVKSNIDKQEKIQSSISCKTKRLFFGSRPRTVNLKRLFVRINPNLLIRTQSAIWDNDKLIY